MTDEERRHDYLCAALTGEIMRDTEYEALRTDYAHYALEIADAMMAATAKPDDKRFFETLDENCRKAKVDAITESPYDENLRLTADIERLKEQIEARGKVMTALSAENRHLRDWNKNTSDTACREIERLTVNNATALEALKAARDHRHAYSTHRLIHAAIKLLEGEAEHDC